MTRLLSDGERAQLEQRRERLELEMLKPPHSVSSSFAHASVK